MRLAVMLILVLISGCGTRPGDPLTRTGDEIVVCGQLFHTGAPVVLWTDPGGYDAYRVERRFVPLAEASWEQTAKLWSDPKSGAVATPERYGLRREGLTDEQVEMVRGGGWTLPLLRSRIDQFVLHYDVCGTSRTCFRVLQDQRGLSVHFMLDIDGTIYQTLDVKERARHATIANDRSVGIEIANIGAYSEQESAVLRRWYTRDAQGWRITLPEHLGGGGVRTPGFIGRPERGGPITGEIRGKPLQMHDLTAQQYDSLIRLTATLCRVFPNLPCDYPRDAQGKLVTRTLTPEEFRAFHGVLGHYHIQDNKIDPGPALDWDRVINGARRMMP